MKATTSQKEIDELLNAIKTGHSKFILSIPVHTTHPMAHNLASGEQDRFCIQIV